MAFGIIVTVGVAYALAVRRPGWRASGRQVLLFSGGLVVLAISCTWPVADLAAHWSLSVLVLQRLLLTLAVPPLLILGTPRPIVAALTRPPAVDALLRRATRPVVAVAVVTVVAVGTLTVGAVDWQSSSVVGRGVLDALLLAAGVVLWAPVLRLLPGTEHPSSLGRAGYLVVQSIVPSFLAVVWIFARHPLYPAFAHAKVFGLAPLTDQQIAGFLAKLSTIAVLWTVAFVILSRGHRASENGGDEEPLTWADVERQLLRVDRSERRDNRLN